MRRGCIYRKLLTDLRRLSDEIPTDVKQSVGIPSELSNLKRLYNGHIYLSATVTWFVGIPSENTDGIPTTLLLIGMSSEIRRNIPTNFRRLQRSTVRSRVQIGACPAVPEATRRKTCSSQTIQLIWNAPSVEVNVPHRLTQPLRRRPTPDHHSRSIPIVRQRSILHRAGHLRNATGQKIDAQGTTGETIKRQEAFARESGADKGKHHVNTIIDDDFWQVVRNEKLEEGDFEIESSMSLGGSQWCRPMSMNSHRSTDHDEDRWTDYSSHRSTSSAKSTECNVSRLKNQGQAKLPKCPDECMPSGTRSNKGKDLLFSDDPAHFERTIRRGQSSTSFDVTTSSSIDTHNQPSTDTRPSSSIDPNRSTRSILHRVRRSIPCRQKWCMPSGTRSNKEKNLLFSDDPAHLERTIRRGQRSTSLDATTSSSIDTHNQPSTDTRPSSSIDPNRSKTIDTTPRTSIDTVSSKMVNIIILTQDENGNLYDQAGHLRNATGQKIEAQGTAWLEPIDRCPQLTIDRRWQRCIPSGTRSNKEKDLLFSDDPAHLERTIRRGQRSTSLDATTSLSIDTHNQPSTDTRPSSSIDPNPRGRRLEIESSMSLGGSQSCPPMSMNSHRSTDHDEDRWTDYSSHQSTSSAKSTECNAVQILTHEEFAAKHPHPPSPFYEKNDRSVEPTIDRQSESDVDRHNTPPID
ncbi:hypothetical protein F2Q68_00015366 [Brassica cretica]|uniref:Uncharacterized protein n=1 Tax=Brassica cretica TaxID=69181 RepID=A0A8S9HQB9_BRACR|nr:hypothetical protein F2Q68_00015366 [Brassica cretica]